MKKADASEISRSAEGESAYQGLKDKVDALPEVSVPTSDDANDNALQIQKTLRMLKKH
ncbi:hypothetical protein INT80_11155 [Gallibacterium anatis]|uniref:Uncharacterized protein n=1 Tax=Gallibacterium anatis TaxID=750 RepID=A0A930UY44_9PAST|nr:hypothetical protein [Gallibacterium anatis]